MENIIKPDQKFYNKCKLVLTTISGITFVPIIFLFFLYLIAHDSNLLFLIATLSIIWLIGQLLIWALSIPIIKLWIKNLEYIILDDHVTIHKGIFTKTQQNIPFRSVTDFALKRTIYDRYLGIGSINIQTAGQSQSASGYEGILIGLINFEKLHSELKGKLKTLHPVSNAATTNKSMEQNDDNVLIQILEELKEIRKNTEK